MNATKQRQAATRAQFDDLFGVGQGAMRPAFLEAGGPGGSYVTGCASNSECAEGSACISHKCVDLNQGFSGLPSTGTQGPGAQGASRNVLEIREAESGISGWMIAGGAILLIGTAIGVMLARARRHERR